ncbi:MAG TPA: lipopolysaccharide biosynthesis protein, partial [Gammaproteobacteria bacterium]|nr:lipopolysaccharide biosynthesis protein [Gammaproteobacteria bacterium]
DYVQVLRRRKAQLIWPALVLMLLAVILTVALPAVYQSSATILIEDQDIPQELVRSTITTYADQQLQVIGQRVMTTANLGSIIKKYNLYASMRKKSTIAAVLDKMRDDINLEMVSADIVDPRSGRPTQTTIAFTLSYDSESPELAQKVASEIASLYLTENIKTRTEKTEDTSNFLLQEGDKLKKQILDIEEKLAAFKEKNAGRLPELVQLNTQLMDRTERELAGIDTKVRALVERKAYLEAELSQINPNVAILSKTGRPIMGPEERLKALKANYPLLLASYTDEHPDVIRTLDEIKSLEKTLGITKDTRGLQLQLNQRVAELATARKKYSDEHPEVNKLKQIVASLKAAIKQESGKRAGQPASITRPDNPAYIQLMAQMNAASTEIASYSKQQSKLKIKLSDLEQRLLDTPQVEREYRSLTRDYENASLRYQEIKAKQMSAQMGEELEKGQKGERLSMIEPPLLPEKPIKPNRMAILFLGFIFSIAGGVGTVAVAESMSQSVRGPASIIKLFDVPPMAIIPYMETEQTVRNRKKKWVLVIVLMLIATAVAAWLVNIFIMPLDVMWFAGLRKIGI